jgi:pimeloyl-ACP methyl ester carboxylesterase/DNA-binding CsgD family transcriptional regulator
MFGRLAADPKEKLDGSIELSDASSISSSVCETTGVRQRIRFCATPAGRVAYSVIGEGPFLLCDTGWVSHLQQMLEIKSFAAFCAALSERFSVVRFDKVGTGLSDRTGADLTFDAQVATVLAIADHLDAKRFHLFGASQGGQVAAAVAAREAERTAGLIVYGMCARGPDLAPEDVRASLVSLVHAHWGLGSDVLARIFQPDPTPEDLKVLAEFQRWAADSDTAADLLAEYYRTDVSTLLPGIEAPTLVLHREDDRATAFRLGREVASLIPSATFVPLHGKSHLFWMGDWQSVVATMLEFLPQPSSPTTDRLSTRELEVAVLVAEGLTNQQIGQKLFIAPRTAETHLENIRQKLGFRSRAQVAAWVTAHGKGKT